MPSQRSRAPWLLLAGTVLVIALVYAAGSNPLSVPPAGQGPHLLVNGQAQPDIVVVVEDETILLPYDLLSESLALPLYQEETESGLIIVATTPNQLLQMATDDLTAWLNQEELALELAPRMIDGTAFLPARPLDRLYGLEVRYHPNTEVVTVDQRDGHLESLTLQDDAVVRHGPSRWQRQVVGAEAGDELVMYGREDGWFKVRTEDGLAGYLDEQTHVIRETLPVLAHPPEGLEERQRPEHPINMTWDHVTPSRPVMSSHSAPPPQGLDVISPTWFHLEDGEGHLQNLARAQDMDWARQHGYHVWPLVSNNFDPDRTREMLQSYQRRERVIRQLLAFAELYGFDGINIDFENVYEEDGPLLVQFTQELAALARQQGLVISIDVTFHSPSPTWSRVYDRPRLADAVDYVIVMAYDEHPGGSRVAGSVASLPWVRRGLERMLEEVPADKLILGIPFYTRLWQVASEGSRETVSVRAFGMHTMRDVMEEHQLAPEWDETYGQYVAAFTDGDQHFKVWIEEERSIRSRVALVDEFGLAGVASWRRGFERPFVWEWIEEDLHSPRD